YMGVSLLFQRRSSIRSRQYSLSDTITLTLGLVVGAFVGSTAGYLGSIMVSKHMALVGDALSHVALPGLALGILFNFNPFIGAFALLVITVIVTWYLLLTLCFHLLRFVCCFSTDMFLALQLVDLTLELRLVFIPGLI